jgi:hypothetical protein
MDVGWNDLGSWGDLLQAIGLPALEARVVRQGDSVVVGRDDLLVERSGGRVRAVAPAADGTMTANDTMALLRGARPFESRVDELLERCSETE